MTKVTRGMVVLLLFLVGAFTGHLPYVKQHGHGPHLATASVIYPDGANKGGVQFEVRGRWGASVVIFRDYGFDDALDEVEIMWPDGTEIYYGFYTGETQAAHAWAEWSPRYYIARQEATTGKQ